MSNTARDLRALTDKESVFVETFSTNGYKRADAIIAAGYSTKDPSSTAYDLLQRPAVQNALAIEKNKNRKFLLLDEMDVIEGLHKEATDSKARPSERIQAWVHIGKHYGMFQTAPVISDAMKEDKRLRIVSYNDPDFVEAQKAEVIEEVGEITTEEASAVLKLVEITDYADNNSSPV